LKDTRRNTARKASLELSTCDLKILYSPSGMSEKING